MNNPERGGRAHEAERRLEITLTDVQRETLLMAIRNEIGASENELITMKAIGLVADQTRKDYSAMVDYINDLESIHALLLEPSKA